MKENEYQEGEYIIKELLEKEYLKRKARLEKWYRSKNKGFKKTRYKGIKN